MSDSEETTPKKRGKVKLIVIGLVVISILGGSAYFFFLKPAPPDIATAAEEPKLGVQGEIVEVGTMTVNLADAEASRYARIGLALLIPPKTDGVSVAGRVSLIRDAALTIIMGYTSEDLLTEDGVESLRQLLTEVAIDIYGDSVTSVLLTELTVQ